jgi:hypothetical protein
MNKKLIRLTESDLHRIVKESVNKILNEALNELDPRTYASYADKRMAQADDAMDAWYNAPYIDGRKYYTGKDPNELYRKAEKGRNAAKDAWNAQYGVNKGNYSPNQEYLSMGDAGFGSYNVTHYNNGESSYYLPHEDSFYDNNARSTNVGKPSNPQAYRVAREMGQGNGNYIKGKGWQ